MKDDFSNLTGQWTGRFEYDRGGQPAPFEADLSETGSSLSGQTREPNSFRNDLGSELFARIEGGRVDTHVSFIKRYDGFDQGGQLIYDGRSNEALTRIEGRWRFSSEPGWGGRFVMMRKVQARRRARRAQTVDMPI